MTPQRPVPNHASPLAPRTHHHVRPRAWQRAGAVLLSAILLGSCAGDSIVAPLVPDEVRVTAPKATLRLGEVLVLSARVGTSEVQVAPQRVAWSSSAPTVATVDSLGAVKGVSRGQTAITAAVTVEGPNVLRGSTVLQVIGVQSLAIAGVPASLTVGGSATLSPTLVVDSGVTGVAVAWRTNDPTIATVNAAGQVTALSIGSATITATAEGVTATAVVKVVSSVARIAVLPVDPVLVAQATRQFTAELTDAGGILLTSPTVVWSSSNAAVATVNSAGLVTAVSPGASTIVATEPSTGKSGSTRVTVVPRVASSLIAPLNPVFYQGQTQQLSVTYFDAAGAVLANRPVIWQSSATAIATVNRSSGVVTGVTPGVATVVAIDSLSGYAASTQVTIAAPVTSVAVDPTSATVVQGAGVQLTAIAYDANGGVLSGRSVAWSSSNASIATISALGLVTAVAPGSVTITALVEGKSATATITVTPPPVASVTVAPTSVSLTVAASQDMTASAFDAAGTVLTGRSVSWSTSSAAVAVISSQGVVTGVAPGTAVVTATVEGKSASATVVVSAPVVTTVQITPASVSVLQGATQQLTATASGATGIPITGRPIVWSSANQAVATISAQGLVTAVAAGTAVISATVDGRSGTATVTVSTAGTASLSITPSTVDLLVGSSQVLLASAIDATGAVLAGRVPTWTSSDATVATVSVTGLVTGVSAGSALIVASLEGKAAAAAVTVTRPPVASVSVTPGSATLTVGTTQSLTASARDANGTLLTGRTVIWSSNSQAVASVSPQGVVTAVTPGTATLTAQVEGRTGTASLSVVPVAVNTVTISPPSGSYTTGTFVQLSASAFDANGAILTGRSVVWNSSTPATATVSAQGGLTAVTPGSVSITATVDGKTATAIYTIVPPPVVAISISPPSVTLLVGSTRQLLATAYDASGAVLTGRPVSWSSATPAIAAVSPQGLLTAISPGSATVSATVEGITERATITVTPSGVATVSITPSVVSLLVGSTQSFTATAFDGNGNVLTGRTITWSSAAPPVATITTGGVLTAVSAGSSTITATIEGRSATATVTVSPVPVVSVRVTPATVNLRVGESQAMTASAADADGGALTGRPVTWSSNTPAVATISAQGVVTAVAAGTAVVTATVEGKTATATISVTVVPVTAVTISPANANLIVGATQSLSAAAYDANGTLLTGRPVLWSSDLPAIASVSAQGVVTAVAPGVAIITATVEGKLAAASITVSAVPVASVSITPSSLNLLVGASQSLTASAADASGTPLTGRPVAWSSGNPAVATVSAQGVVTAITAGTATINALVEGRTAAAVVTVSAVPVVSVSVSPASANLTVGDVQQLTAAAFDASNNPLTGRVVTWSSANPAIATITTLGAVTAVAPGTVNMVASVEGRTATASITVSQVPVATVTMSPTSLSMIVGATQQFTATAFAANGTVLTGRGVVWSSSASTIASISSQGVLTAIAAGTTTITALVEGKTTSTTVTVSLVPIASVTVTPSTFSMPAVSTKAFIATAFDGAGNVITGRAVSWSSSNPAVASISAQGVLTAAASPGVVVVTATVEGFTATAAVTITAPTVATVTLNTFGAVLTVGGTQVIVATAYDAQGGELVGRAVSWTTANAAIATISAAGVVTATGAGSTTVTATIDGVRATASVQVTAPVSAVVISPRSANLLVGAVQQLNATSLDAAGNTLARRAVVWTSSNSAVASVSSQGLLTALSAGSATISATVEGQTATMPVTVTIASVNSVTMTPNDGYLPTGIAVPLSVTLRDVNGSILAGRPVTWSSSASAVAQVTSAGVVTAGTTGSVSITATAEGRSAIANFIAHVGLQSGTPVTVSNAVAEADRFYAVYVPAGATRLTVAISGGTGDPDLSIFQPGNTGTADCRPFLFGSSEECVFTQPVAGVWLVAINAYLPHSGTRLIATVTP